MIVKNFHFKIGYIHFFIDNHHQKSLKIQVILEFWNYGMSVTAQQLRAARTLLSWQRADIAERAGLAPDTITNIENEIRKPYQKTLEKLITAYELEGIEFIKGGVRRTDTLIRLTGPKGFQTFLDDVYRTAIAYGTKEKPTEVFLSNVVHENWIKAMGKEQWTHHTDRMIQHKDVMDVRIIVKEYDWTFPAIEYASYKWVKADQFNDKSFYSYHNKLAFLNFSPENVEITIMQQEEFAEGYRKLFLNTWEYVAFDPVQT